MNRRLIRWCLCAAVVGAVPVGAGAQSTSPPSEPGEASIRLGILSIDPRFGVRDVGIDTNVFAEADNPQRDTTATVVTGGDAWVRTGRGRLMFMADAEMVYFAKFSAERALNSRTRAGYEFRFNRLRPFASIATLDAKERPNDEISARVRRNATELRAGFDLRILSKGTARVEWSRERTLFDEAAKFSGRSLRQELSLTTERARLEWQQQLTVLTTFVARAAYERDQFEFAEMRDGENYRVDAGFELGQRALIRGNVFVGYQEFRAKTPGVIPEYSGLTANVNVAYSAPTRTRLAAVIDRGLHHSFDPRTPHYRQQGWQTTITQRLAGGWEVQATGGRASQAFSSVVTAAARTDYLDRVGGGIGYVLDNHTRVSLDVTSINRITSLPGQAFSGISGGLSVTYGY